MSKKTLDVIDVITFIMTPEDSTYRYPDSPFLLSSCPHHMHMRGYHHIIKTLFWVFVSAACSVIISQLS